MPLDIFDTCLQRVGKWFVNILEFWVDRTDRNDKDIWLSGRGKPIRLSKTTEYFFFCLLAKHRSLTSFCNFSSIRHLSNDMISVEKASNKSVHKVSFEEKPQFCIDSILLITYWVKCAYL